MHEPACNPLYPNLLTCNTVADGEHFFNFLKNIFRGNVFVIGFKQGKLPAMGEKKEAVTSEFKKSREAGESLHFTYIKQLHISQSRDIQASSTLRPQFVDICYCPRKTEGKYLNYREIDL